ncbi:MAG: flagellar protein FlaG [Desulforhopalus sp.]
MQVEAISVTGSSLQQLPKAGDSIDAGRRELEKGQADLEKSSGSDKGGVQPEEILSQIKSLTEDGLYSVRFENNREFNELVVKVVDTETDEVIRQVPAEEVLGVKASLAELRGKIVDTIR